MAALFRSVRVGDGTVDIRWSEGEITEIGAAGSLYCPAGTTVVRGGMMTPSLAEPHVHLDAALLAGQAPNVSGTLREGIANWAKLRPNLTAYDLESRARQTLEMYRSWGCTHVRTHVDTGSLLAVEVLLSLREEFPNLQVVAFPQEGILRAPERKSQWEAAVEMGCDAVGAIPHFERSTEEGWESVRLAFALARKKNLKVDLHCDETDDPNSRNLEVACVEAQKGGVAHVVAGHCTAMHSYPNPYAAKMCELAAASGVQIVCNPLDNIVLQGRYDGYPKRRGLTRVDELWAAGAAVGIGHDSVMDPWYPLGTANLLDAAYMLVHAGHLTGQAEMRRVVRTLFTENYLPWGPPPEIKVGATVFAHWPVSDEIELLRLRPKPTLYGA